MANREQLEELADTISNSIKESIQSAFKSVVIPANVGNLVQDISQSFETKNMDVLGTAIGKTNTLIEKVGFNLEKFGKGINNTFEKYLAQKTAAEKEVEEMKEQNVLGQTALIKNEIKATTVNNEELTTRKEIIEREEEQLNLKEENLNPQELVLLHKDTEYNKKREKLQKEKKRIQRTEKQNNEQLEEVLGGNRTAGGFYKLPEFIQGPLSLFVETLKTPIYWIQDMVEKFKDFAKGLKQTAQFLVGNFLQALKSVRKGFRRLRRGMRRWIGRGIRFVGLALVSILPILAGVGGLFAGLIPVIRLLLRRFWPLAAVAGVLGLAFKALKGSMPSLGETMVKFLLGTKGLAAMQKAQGPKVGPIDQKLTQDEWKEHKAEQEEIIKEETKKIQDAEKAKPDSPFYKDFREKGRLSDIQTKSTELINIAKMKIADAEKYLKKIDLIKASTEKVKDIKGLERKGMLSHLGTGTNIASSTYISPVIDSSTNTSMNKTDNAFIIDSNVNNQNSIWAVPDFMKGDYR